MWHVATLTLLLLPFSAHSNRKCVLFSGIDDKSGEMVVLSEWNVKAAPDTSLPTLQRQLSSLEQEINYLVKLRHQNLSHYLSMKYDYNNDEDVVVYILREFIYGNSNIFFVLNGNSCYEDKTIDML